MNRTKIEYLDFTWNPMVGCSGVDCAVRERCWAKPQAKRRKHLCVACYRFLPHSHPERLMQPYRMKTQSRIGVCFSADFWDQGFTMKEREFVMGVVTVSPWHWFINLTKQPQNIPECFQFPKNWVQGVSVNCKNDLWRIDRLKQTQANLKAISYEPLYEDLGEQNLKEIDWIMVGPQTRPLILPKKEWLDNVVIAAIAQSVPVFMKNKLSEMGVGIIQQCPLQFSIPEKEPEAKK